MWLHPSLAGIMGRSRIAPVAATEDALARLGKHITTARMRREWRQEDLARKAGIHPNTLRKVESGAPGTAIGAYAAALWALGLLEHLSEVARPDRDREGETLATARLGERARAGTMLDDNF
jgi:ribosome-binding protein aMBF1 (putative translation factor)